jgi:hypothetical protein
MGAAFDRACQHISKRMNDNEDVKKKTVALIILRHVDRGEHDPDRLAESAFREWTSTDRSAMRERWSASARPLLSPVQRGRAYTKY